MLASSSLLVANDIVIYTLSSHMSPLVLPIVLKSDYGYMVINQGGTKAPKPLYILADRERGIVQRFNSKKSFLASLSAIQKKGIMKRYDKCISPLSYGLLDEHYVAEEVKSICLSKGITLGGRDMHCNCKMNVTDEIYKQMKIRREKLRKKANP